MVFLWFRFRKPRSRSQPVIADISEIIPRDPADSAQGSTREKRSFGLPTSDVVFLASYKSVPVSQDNLLFTFGAIDSVSAAPLPTFSLLM